MGLPRLPILSAFAWAQSNNNFSRVSLPLEAWGGWGGERQK